MAVSPSGDLAAIIQQTMPAIPPLQVPGFPSMPAPPGTGPSVSPDPGICTMPGFAKLFPQLCPHGGAIGGNPNTPATTGSALCKIPLVGQYACDLGARIGFTALAIILIAIGVYVLIGGGVTVVLPEAKPLVADLSLKRKKGAA